LFSANLNAINAGASTVSADDSRTHIWWLGTNVKIDAFDPLTFGLDVVYGRMNRTDVGGLQGTSLPANLPGFTGAGPNQRVLPGVEVGTEGWFIGATLDYKLDFMTPGIFGWWASGDKRSDVEDGMLGRLPSFGTDAGFKATSFGMKGYYGISNGNNSTTISRSGVGTWGVGIQLADITFIKDLKHTLRLAYYRGTNDADLVRDLGGFAPLKYRADPVYLTNNDSVWEVNFDHQYKIYENLTAVLELGYLHLSSDRDTWGNRGGLSEGDDAWKAEVLFQYAF
jgi:hypothetical protein